MGARLFMKVEGIVGPATGKYRGWIELVSVHHGVLPRLGTAQGGYTIAVSKHLDHASPALTELALNLERRRVMIDLVRDDRLQTLQQRSELEDAWVSSVRVGGHSSKGDPLEVVYFEYTRMTVENVVAKAAPSAH